METQLAATRRATKMHNWVQMIIAGALYGGLGIVILVIGAAAASIWFAGGLAAATVASSIAAIVASRGFAGAVAFKHRFVDVVFVILMEAVAVSLVLLPGTAQFAGLPLVWFAVLVAGTLTAAWIGGHGLLWKTKLLALITASAFLLVVIVFVLLFLFDTDRPATVFIAVVGFGMVAAAFPVRSLELRHWHVDPVA